MKQDELRKFLGIMLHEAGYLDSEAFAVFGQLIRLTIEYRDKWKAEKDEILTVRDTKKALRIYEEVLKTGMMPDNLEAKIDGLIRLWLKKINGLHF
ncbi:MAG: hypothetical protein AB1746_05080 [Candidatus Zixiibacteriota bacterium]